MKAMVTGGAGFIGSHLIDALLAGGNEVVAIDNFDPFYDRTIKESNIENHLRNDRYTLIEADIRNRELMDCIFEDKKPDIVIHLAAKAGVRPSLENPLQYVEVNVNGTVNVLDSCVKHGVKKLIFASSSSVYGLNEKVPFAENDPILQQASPYGATKASGESICRSYSHCFNLPIVALRFFTVYGPRQRPDLAIHKFAAKIVKDETIQLFGDGTTSRDYTYIDDIVSGVIASMHYPLQGYEVFNLGNDRPTTLIDLVRSLETILGKKAEVEWLPEQIGDVPRTWANISKSKRLLHYEPSTDLQTGLGRFADWLHSTRRTRN